MSEPLLSVRNITKSFGGLVAVNDVSFDVRPRRSRRPARRQRRGKVDADQVHLRRLSRRTRARSSSRASARSSPIRWTRAATAIETIYQDLALANNLDVGANIFLGREVKKRYFGGLIHTLDNKTMLQRIAPNARFPADPVSHPDRADREPVRRPAPGGRDRPRGLLGRQARDHGRADQQSRRPRAEEGARTHPPLARPRRSGDPDHPHPARRVRGDRPPHRHASRPQGRGEDHRARPTPRSWCNTWSARATTPARRSRRWPDRARRRAPKARRADRTTRPPRGIMSQMR